MTDIEPSINWNSSFESIKEEVVHSLQYSSEDGFDKIPTIVVESNQQSEHTDAPILIYPNDPSAVGAEEVVIGDDQSYMQCASTYVVEEEVIANNSGAYGNSADEDLVKSEDFADIPLNDESYATFHPFPCDFCSRRFKKKANLINHMVAHQTQRPHGCDVCHSSFMRKCDLVNHQKIHSYVPNRDNRDDIYETKPLVWEPRRRKRSSNYQRPPKPQTPPSSPENNSYFKPTSYVDEDVKLLLEMTTKLHESRRSECSDSNVPVSAPAASQRKVGTEGKPYVCSKCDRCFARESALVSHSQVHSEDSSYNCSKCGSRFFTRDLLREHYSKKHDTVYAGESSDYDSDKDDKSYTGDVRFGAFFCTICSVSFHRLDLLKAHKKIHVMKRDEFVERPDTSKRDEYPGLYHCGWCNAMFVTNEKLRQHVEANYTCQRHVCVLCGEMFSDREQVRSHIKTAHPKLPSNTCGDCGQQCRDSKSLEQHMIVHTNEKRFAKSSSTAPSSASKKLLPCSECDLEFSNKAALVYHEQNHYNSSNNRKFMCNECGKSFGSRSSQQIHNRIHTGERPYGCRYCWKAFTDGGTLRKHERIHTGEKPYVCAVCPRAFNQRVVLREHIRSHHSGATNKIGFPTAIYLCPVCGIVTSGSDELALHIVKHSDDNTIKNRAPRGSRPYKRRKKPEAQPNYYRLPAFESNNMYENENSDTDSAESDREKKPATRKTTRPRKQNNYARFSKTMDAAVRNINSLVEQQPVRKAKMITTKLQSSPGKARRGAKKRGRRAVEVSSVVTMLKPRVRTMSGRLSGRRDQVEEPMSPEKVVSDEGSRSRVVRPRTKNVNYETLRAMNKGLEQATFPENARETVKKEQEDITTEIDDVGLDSYVCGICKASFNSKADLLFHVPAHI